jgi:hypothetical protein
MANPVGGDSALANVPGITGTNSALGGVVLNVPESSWGEAAGVLGSAPHGVGVHGDSANGNGVQGTSAGGNGSGVLGAHSGSSNGVYGTSVTGNAVAGTGKNGNGGWFESLGSGTGVFGTSVNGDGVHGKASDATKTAVVGEHTGGGKAGYFNGPVQVDGTHTVNGDLTVNGDHFCTGTLSVTKDIVLPFAADFAEDFQVEASEGVDPGTAMVLNDNGVLRPCEKSYDRKVAGVISGAGDYRPGLILDRQMSSEDRLPLALVGKVYCKVDAYYGAVEVGDLLTTSATPGHAMKAGDPLLAFGAVLGKALRPLKSGRGLIPILVALQ